MPLNVLIQMLDLKQLKDSKRLAFGYRNFKDFKTKILIFLNIKKEKTYEVFSRIYFENFTHYLVERRVLIP